MSEASKIQVGGDHYKTAYNHWDFVLDTGLGYLEGCATKYVSRWRKKNGLEDLQKAQHYLQKLIESSSQFKPPPAREGDTVWYVRCISFFAESNGLDFLERRFCAALVDWRRTGNFVFLQDAEIAIQKLISSATGAVPVPLEDSNKHADRAKKDTV